MWWSKIELDANESRRVVNSEDSEELKGMLIPIGLGLIFVFTPSNPVQFRIAADHPQSAVQFPTGPRHQVADANAKKKSLSSPSTSSAHHQPYQTRSQTDDPRARASYSGRDPARNTSSLEKKVWGKTKRTCDDVPLGVPFRRSFLARLVVGSVEASAWQVYTSAPKCSNERVNAAGRPDLTT